MHYSISAGRFAREQFHQRIMNAMPPDQVPNRFTINADAAFLDRRLFTP